MVDISNGSAWMSGQFPKTDGKIDERIENVIVYIDNLLIHSKTHEHHLIILDIVMTRLADNNMMINIAKCFFGNTEVNYLGFRLTPQGIKPGKDKLKAVEQVKIPASKEEIKFFCWSMQFLQDSNKRFCKNL
jgi:hypothetical protein